MVTALAAVLLPRVSNLYARGEYKKEHPLIRGSIQATMAIALPCAFGLSAIAEKMVPWYYGTLGQKNRIPGSLHTVQPDQRKV